MVFPIVSMIVYTKNPLHVVRLGRGLFSICAMNVSASIYKSHRTNRNRHGTDVISVYRDYYKLQEKNKNATVSFSTPLLSLRLTSIHHVRNYTDYPHTPRGGIRVYRKLPILYEYFPECKFLYFSSIVKRKYKIVLLYKRISI